MGKLREFTISFDHPHAVYTAADLLTGDVLLTLDEPMEMKKIYVCVQGRGRIHFMTERYKRTGHVRAEEIYFQTSFILYGDDSKKTVHPSGEHAYRFQMTIPEDCPSSFEGMYGSVRYVCKAVIDKPWKFNHNTKTAFTVIHPLDLNKENALMRVPETFHRRKIFYLCCFKQGEIIANFTINKLLFLPGENILINAEIVNNTYKKIMCTEIKIEQCVQFNGKMDSVPETKEEKYEVATLKRPKIKARETDILENVPLRIPSVPSSRLDGCRCINIMYKIKFIVRGWEKIQLESEIIIGTVPLNPPPQSSGLHPSAPEVPSVVPSAPVLPCPSAPVDLPPSFEECVRGKRRIVEEGDSQFTRGELRWAPSYPMYQSSLLDWRQPPSTSAEDNQEGEPPSTSVENSQKREPSSSAEVSQERDPLNQDISSWVWSDDDFKMVEREPLSTSSGHNQEKQPPSTSAEDSQEREPLNQDISWVWSDGVFKMVFNGDLVDVHQ